MRDSLGRVVAIPESRIVLTAQMVHARIAKDFGSADHAAVADVLKTLGERYRLQLAVLRIARGDLARVAPLTAEARDGDFRDVLAAAEYPRSSAVSGNRPEFMPSKTELHQMRLLEKQEYLDWLRECQ